MIIVSLLILYFVTNNLFLVILSALKIVMTDINYTYTNLNVLQISNNHKLL